MRLNKKLRVLIKRIIRIMVARRFDQNFGLKIMKSMVFPRKLVSGRAKGKLIPRENL